MTKKNYIRAVELIKQSGAKGKAQSVMTETFIQFFQEENPNFDRKRFIAAVLDWK